MLGSSDKKNQQQSIKTAKNLRKQFVKTPPPTERYHV